MFIMSQISVEIKQGFPPLSNADFIANILSTGMIMINACSVTTTIALTTTRTTTMLCYVMVDIKMAKRSQVTQRHSAEIAALYQKAGVLGAKLLQLFPQYSKASIYRHAKKPIGEDAPCDKRTHNKGRPSKLTPKDKRRILRSVPKLRDTDGSFTSPRIAVEAGVEDKVSNRTIRRVLRSDGYSYLRSRKKGLMTKEDLKKRMTFCMKVRKLKLGQEFWNHHVSFYLDSKDLSSRRIH